MELVSLKELCRLVNVSRRSIQCYEKAGLMMPTDKNKYGYLLYDRDAVSRAKMIKFLQETGFKLQEIKELINAPGSVLKTTLIGKLDELEKEKARLESLIMRVNKYIENIN